MIHKLITSRIIRVPFSSPVVAILATRVARLFGLSQEGGLRGDGGLFGETVFVLGESCIIFHLSLFLYIGMVL